MFNKIFGGGKNSSNADDDAATDMETALAALFVEAARADEHYDDDEKSLIEGALRESFGVNAETAVQLREAGEAAQKNALDIQRFTKHAKTLPGEDKLRFIEALWRIVLSDGVRDPYEDTLIRRICGLIYVSDRASGEARNRAAAAIDNA